MARASYTVSARGKFALQPVIPYLLRHFGTIPLNEIESVFGFLDPCTLYGGRPYWYRQLSDADVSAMQAHRIGVRIPITNHFVDRAEYDRNHRLFRKYHRKGNALIIHNDALVPWVRQDFPLYTIEASMLKFLNSYDKIRKALELYDTVVLPMDLTENHEFLKGVPDKERITLFGNGGCALTCPARMCYAIISRMNKILGSRNPAVRLYGHVVGVSMIKCSQTRIYRKQRGVVDFDLDKLEELGFHRFKMLRARPGHKTGF
jgi:hypothetical protein